MDPPDDDIEFDFFEDEPQTAEASTSRVRLPRRGSGGGPRRGPSFRRPAGPPRGATPFLRLLVAVAVAIAVLVFFGLLIQSCASTSKHAEYASYMNKVATIAHSSAADGTAVASALTTPGLKISDLQTKLSGIAEQERQNIAAAQHLDPPGPLRPENQNLIEALQLRVLGTQQIAYALQGAAAAKSTASSSAKASLLAQQAERLLASDVVWDDLFLSPSRTEMQNRGVRGVAPPESHFVSNPDLVTVRSMSGLLQRLQGVNPGGTVTGRHGTNLVSVKATPKGPTLSTSVTLNQITASPDLGFDAVVHNGGDSQEVGVKVTLTIQREPAAGQAIVQTKTIAAIDPNQDVVVHFTRVDVGALIAERAKLTVDVAPVLGEVVKSNNSASYPVIFSLG
jgi:hypothetical protein